MPSGHAQCVQRQCWLGWQRRGGGRGHLMRTGRQAGSWVGTRLRSCQPAGRCSFVCLSAGQSGGGLLPVRRQQQRPLASQALHRLLCLLQVAVPRICLLVCREGRWVQWVGGSTPEAVEIGTDKQAGSALQRKHEGYRPAVASVAAKWMTNSQTHAPTHGTSLLCCNRKCHSSHYALLFLRSPSPPCPPAPQPRPFLVLLLAPPPRPPPESRRSTKEDVLSARRVRSRLSAGWVQQVGQAVGSAQAQAYCGEGPVWGR